MAGGIKITPRNLSFILTDKNKTKFSDNKTDETLKWIKSTLIFYYVKKIRNLIYLKNHLKTKI